MMKGQKSRLAIGSICQKCAKCCKVFEMTFPMDSAIRFKWMHDEGITAEDTDFVWSDGISPKKVTFHKGCKQLGVKNGIYFCKRHNEERPDFCCTYPDNTFVGIEKWNTQKLQKQIDENKTICPLFEKYTVQDVIDKLYDKEGCWMLPFLETDLSLSLRPSVTEPQSEG